MGKEHNWLSTYDFTTYTEGTQNILSNCNAITFFAPPAGAVAYQINKGPIMASGDPPLTLSAASPDEMIVTTFLCAAMAAGTIEIPIARKITRRAV